MGFPGSSDGKESACNAGDSGSIPGSGRSPGEGNGNPQQYYCLENSKDRPWCRKELDMTESLSLTPSLHLYNHSPIASFNLKQSFSNFRVYLNHWDGFQDRWLGPTPRL